MSVKPTIFSVVDVETCRPSKGQGKGLVFDVGWAHVDRRFREYGHGTYLARDVLSQYTPFFRHKTGQYYTKAFDHNIVPTEFEVIRKIYNNEIRELLENGHRVVFCAYNAKFDTGALSYTSQLMCGGLPFLEYAIEIMCIWQAWAQSCPMNYWAPKTPSGKYLQTKAETVFAFEYDQQGFEEDHTGYADVKCEVAILRKVLGRKRKLPIVKNPRELVGGVHLIANKRIGFTGQYK